MAKLTAAAGMMTRARRRGDSAQQLPKGAIIHVADVQDMKRQFKVRDRVTWNPEAGHVSGRIIKIHTRDVVYKGYTHHASKDEPQYEIKSDATDHVAMHKGSALKHKRR